MLYLGWAAPFQAMHLFLSCAVERFNESRIDDVLENINTSGKQGALVTSPLTEIYNKEKPYMHGMVHKLQKCDDSSTTTKNVKIAYRFWIQFTFSTIF